MNVGGNTGSATKSIHVTATGEVEVVSAGVAIAKESGGNLATIAGDTTSIDGKITACNTGAVVISSGTVAATQSGTWNVTNVSGTVSLPTGAATSAKQLADGHNVTIDNAGGGSAVNIQDGGNAITVDNGGTFAVQSTLQTGSAAIGKLAANSGVDIGDVDVTSLPDSIDGGGTASGIDSYADADINLAASTANQEIVAAPGASKQIWVYGIAVTAAAASTFSLQDEDDTALTGVMAMAETGGFVINPSGNFAMPWIKVATNKALEVDTGGGTIDGVISYAIVSV